MEHQNKLEVQNQENRIPIEMEDNHIQGSDLKGDSNPGQRSD